MNNTRNMRPEPNFARLITDEDLRRIAISAHALRRFVQRLQPDIPGADYIADAMARLEDLGSGNRSGPEQGKLNRYCDWMAKHVEPVVLVTGTPFMGPPAVRLTPRVQSAPCESFLRP